MGRCARRPTVSQFHRKRGRGGLKGQGSQGSVKSRAAGHCSFDYSAPSEGNFLQPPAVGQAALARHRVCDFPGLKGGIWGTRQGLEFVSVINEIADVVAFFESFEGRS